MLLAILSSLRLSLASAGCTVIPTTSSRNTDGRPVHRHVFAKRQQTHVTVKLYSPMMKRVAVLFVAAAIAGAPLALEACLIDCAAATRQTAARTVTSTLARQSHGAHCRQTERPPADNTESSRQQLSGDPAACTHGPALTARAVLTLRAHTVVCEALGILSASVFDGARVPAFDSKQSFTCSDRMDLGLSLPLRI
jgi:hypothetical protein